MTINKMDLKSLIDVEVGVCFSRVFRQHGKIGKIRKQYLPPVVVVKYGPGGVSGRRGGGALRIWTGRRGGGDGRIGIVP